MNVERAIKNDRMLRSVIWIWSNEFEEILVVFEPIIDEYYRNLKENRERTVWGWRKWKLKDAREKLFFILFYSKVYPTYDLVAFLYDVTRSKPFYWVTSLLPLLEKALWRKALLPSRKTSNLEELLKKFPEMKELFVDWTERPINRPKSNKQQRKNYSWKKKRHTVKNTIVCNSKRKILFLWKTEEWKIHDKKLYDKDWLWNVDIDKYWDTWYIGWNWITTPKKKSKKNELTEEEKEYNRIISSYRVVVENSIAWLKRFWIMSHKLRNRVYGNFSTVKMDFKDKIILVCAGLHNLTIK
jgi:hypothetical protein